MKIDDQNLDFIATLNEDTIGIEAVNNESLLNSEIALPGGCAGTFGSFGCGCGCAGTFGTYGSFGCGGSN